MSEPSTGLLGLMKMDYLGLAREEGVLVAEKAHEIATRSTESSCQMNMFQEDNYMDEDKDQFRIFILA